jgi:lambda family phage portal protein
MARLNLIQRAARGLARAAGVRAYEAATDQRFRQGSVPGSGSANAEASLAGKSLSLSARDAVRNDAFASRIVNLWAANAVGAGVTCAWEDERHAAAWKRWAETTACDAERLKTLAGIEAMVMRSVVMDGEALIVLRPERPSERNPVGLTLQVMEADHLDRDKTGIYEGRSILQGVEVDEMGRCVARWILPRHPGEVWPHMPALGIRKSVRMPAEMVLHVFRQDRPGQVRGVSWLAPVLATLADLKGYESALLMKAKIEACLAAIVTSDDDEQTLTGSVNPVKDADGNTVEQFEPGMIAYRRGAGSVEIVNPSGGGSHMQFARRALERAAVGAGLTYDQVSGDLTGANYSSLRAGKIEFRSLNSQVQWTLLLPQLCVPVADAFHRYGAIAGLWPDQAAEYMHTPEMPEMVDPLKDLTAVVAQVRAGLLSPQRAAAMFGYDYQTLVAEIAAADEMRDDAGVIVDSDPRRLAKSGVAHDAQQVAAVEIGATGASGDGSGVAAVVNSSGERTAVTLNSSDA